MKIITKDFINGGEIPSEFTCDGEGKMFDLKVSELPEGTKAMAMVIEDPDASSGLFTHFLAWNIPVTGSIADCSDILATSLVGANTGGSAGYTPPCPPSGSHRYFVRFYALNDLLDLEAGSKRKEFDQALQDRVIQEAEVMGVYSRGR